MQSSYQPTLSSQASDSVIKPITTHSNSGDVVTDWAESYPDYNAAHELDEYTYRSNLSISLQPESSGEEDVNPN